MPGIGSPAMHTWCSWTNVLHEQFWPIGQQEVQSVYGRLFGCTDYPCGIRVITVYYLNYSISLYHIERERKQPEKKLNLKFSGAQNHIL